MAASRKTRAIDLIALVERALLPFESAPRLRIALSGGCDSMALLQAVSQTRFLDRLEAVHVHHGLSPNADAWEQFCEAACRARGVPFFCARIAVDRDSPEGLEAAARASRYHALFQDAPTVLLLAQHQDDLAETVLFNLLRGTGLPGLSGFPAVRVQGGVSILRPFFTVDRAAIERWAMAQGVTWIEDESNAETAFSRNFIRHAVFPEIRKRFPGASASMATAARHCADAQRLLLDLAALDWDRLQQGGALPIAAIRGLRPPRLANLIRFRLQQLGWRAPVTARLDEFVRQLLVAAPDRHPGLILTEGVMRVSQGALHWISAD